MTSSQNAALSERLWCTNHVGVVAGVVVMPVRRVLATDDGDHKGLFLHGLEAVDVPRGNHHGDLSGDHHHILDHIQACMSLRCCVIDTFVNGVLSLS